MPIVYVSRRLGRASDIAHLLEQGGCSIRLGPSPAKAPAVARFSPDEIARYFGDVDAIVVGTGETISDDVVVGARRLAGWDCRVLCHDPYVKQPDADAYGVALVDLDTLLRSADVVSVQATLTAETLHMIGARELGLMRREAYLVNTARGPLVDEA